jgi:hypothetical protein
MADSEHGESRESRANVSDSEEKDDVLSTDREIGTEEATNVESQTDMELYLNELATRRRKLTMKGQAYQIEKYIGTFQSFISNGGNSLTEYKLCYQIVVRVKS